ncbi:D-alanine--D-alanine ligase [Agarilytica rhodophyticola]|uniref:D-alanine--D-alanine ligase n=1 Tax=Agarilytica rhodophyticola TaxID=1737490 RepID=UPI001FEA17AD|nr:D-alanine--D-alanine ligase [Agarilytica rhodophyticola]
MSNYVNSHSVETQVERPNQSVQTKKLFMQDIENQDPENRGLPKLELGSKPVSFFEFWPAWFFYIPIVIYWILLSLRYRNFGLPMVVNPHIDLGGMVGESKLAILESAGEFAQTFVLPCVISEYVVDDALYKSDESLLAHVENELTKAEAKDITLPLVVKPELGCRGAGVRLIHNKMQLVEYLRLFPKGRRYILQKLAPYSAEAGVFYERMPGEAKGRVTSITLKYRPYVIGDGVSTLKTLILKDSRASILRDVYFERNVERLYSVPKPGECVPLAFAGSHSRGSVFRNGNEFISTELSEKIDEVMQDFPDFHYGRLDVKFNNIHLLKEGKEFVIIEINGVSSEKTHIWDSRTSLYSAFATLFEQYTTLFKMGYEMHKRGHRVPSAITLVKTWLRELKQSNEYPSTD